MSFHALAYTKMGEKKPLNKYINWLKATLDSMNIQKLNIYNFGWKHTIEYTVLAENTHGQIMSFSYP